MGWLHTGDIGHIDADGHLYVVDRLKELIKYKGLSGSPGRLEAVLLRHPDVTDAAVIGLPDEEAGEIPVGYIDAASGYLCHPGRDPAVRWLASGQLQADPAAGSDRGDPEVSLRKDPAPGAPGCRNRPG